MFRRVAGLRNGVLHSLLRVLHFPAHARIVPEVRRALRQAVVSVASLTGAEYVTNADAENEYERFHDVSLRCGESRRLAADVLERRGEQPLERALLLALLRGQNNEYERDGRRNPLQDPLLALGGGKLVGGTIARLRDTLGRLILMIADHFAEDGGVHGGYAGNP